MAMVELTRLSIQNSSLTTVSIAARSNNGDGTFASPQFTTFPAFLPFSFSFGDFNGDGRTDIQVNALDPGVQLDSNDSISLAKWPPKFPPE